MSPPFRESCTSGASSTPVSTQPPGQDERHHRRTGKETAQEATRTTANGHGDKLGKVGTVISTKVSNPEIPDSNKFQEGAHTGQWETYTGTYIATGTVTRFAFHSIEGYSAWDGNLLDDISFSKAYKLTYDKNASDATGKVPSNQRGKENAVEPAESKTTGNVKTVADNTSNLPDHLVNGTFDYRGNEIINENQRVYGSHDTTYLAIISAKTGIIGNPLHSKLDNWDSGKFGWRSNDDTAGADTVEVQRRNHTPYPTNAGNVWGEIAAAKRGKYIYQDIATTPGVVYKWSLKHASRNADQDDSMQVMIGEPGAEAVQEATRTTSNGTDKVGEKSTTITTHGTAQDGRWETYTGDYLATSTTTRFTFRSVRDSNGQGLDFTAEGNCVDDLSFGKAYKLSYDKNSSDATGSVPSNQYGKENTVQPAKSKTTGTVKTVADENVRYGSSLMAISPTPRSPTFRRTSRKPMPICARSSNRMTARFGTTCPPPIFPSTERSADPRFRLFQVRMVQYRERFKGRIAAGSRHQEHVCGDRRPTGQHQHLPERVHRQRRRAVQDPVEARQPPILPCRQDAGPRGLRHGPRDACGDDPRHL